MDVYAYLQQEINIRNSKQYPVIRRMDISESEMTKYSHSLHRLLESRGEDFALEKILDVYRVNPLLAVKTMESCSLNARVKEVAGSLKLLFSAIDYEKTGRYISGEGKKVILNDMIPFTILLIEAAFQDSVCDMLDIKEVFLRYAKDQDYEAYKNGRKPSFLNGYNIRHILRNVPVNRQIELINWFWTQHCYATKNYRKEETYAGRRVDIMMKELAGACLWKHLENMESADISERERESIAREGGEIARFVDNTITEGHHLQYVKVVLGDDALYEKIGKLLGAAGVERYKQAVAKQERLEEEKRIIEEKKWRMGRYYQLVGRVRKKYQKMETQKGPLGWYDIGKKEQKDQISLWTYWQGAKFEQVKLMVIKQDFGSLQQSEAEREEFVRKIRAFKKGCWQTQYYSFKGQKSDQRLERLFQECFGRNIRKEHYSDLFFTTLCLGYRATMETVISDEQIEADVDAFLLEELKIVQPQAVFCLGSKVYRMFMEGLSRQKTEEVKVVEDEPEKRGVADVDGQKIRVYALPHLGGAHMKQDDWERQKELWHAVKEDMEEHGIVLHYRDCAESKVGYRLT